MAAGESCELVQEIIYDPSFVQKLFDEMSATYGLVNLVSSFGVCRKWRQYCLRQIEISSGCTTVDLMTGMGELCPEVAQRLGPQGRIVAVDISPVMCAQAQQHQKSRFSCTVEIMEADALCSSIPDDSADVVVSSFGLKTFSLRQIERLAQEVKRILKPQGTFSFVEISVPPAGWLKVPYLFYLNRLIPMIGRLLLGNPENYRMLGIYTRAFGSCHRVVSAFRNAGLETEVRSFWLGCATGLVGRHAEQLPGHTAV